MSKAPWPADAVERRDISRLTPYARNARTHSDNQVAQIAASIKEWGWTMPVLVDEHDGVIAGHGRLMAARKLGLADVPVLVARGWTEAQKRAYVLADNKLTLNGGWDNDLLKVELEELGAAGFDLALTGFDPNEIAGLTLVTEGLTDPDETPPVPEVPVTIEGDLWICGRHRIVCGSSTESTVWDRLDVRRPCLTFTSPPYGVGASAKLRDHYVKGKAERKSLYDKHTDDPNAWPDLMRGWASNAISCSDVVLCNVQMLAENKRHLVAWLGEFSEYLVDIAVWDKGSGAPQMARNVLTNSFEWMIILSSKQGASRSVPLANFHGTISNICRVNARGTNEHADVHRATMPVELAMWGINLATQTEQVAEPFCGTGTTVIASEMLGKSCRAIELSAQYVDVAVKRWQDFTGQDATLEGDGRTFNEIATSRGKKASKTDGAPPKDRKR